MPIALPALFALLLPLSCAGPAEAEDIVLPCQMMPDIMGLYLKYHSVYEAPDDVLTERAVDAWMDGLDPAGILLTQSAFEELRPRVQQAVVDAQEGECSALDQLHADRIAWHRELAEFAEKELDGDFVIDEDTILQLDPELRPRPATLEERGALRRSLFQFFLANYVDGGVELPEAREKLTARYARTAKQLAELEDAEVHATFLKTWASGLDPHSTFFSADDLEDFQISMQLSLQGIGAVLQAEDGFITVQEVVAGGAADRQGQLKPEDKIVAVAQDDGEPPVTTIDMPIRDVVRMIRGEKGTKVHLTILRDGHGRKQITIVRDEIQLKDQAAKLVWEEREVDGNAVKLAVIELPSFYGNDEKDVYAVEDVRRLLSEAKEKGADGVLLDLSRNGGGLLDEAVAISGLFIDRGPIVAVEGRGMKDGVEADKEKGLAWSGPLVVQTSRISASASEILAGALQDYERAVIVGDTQTYGKGSVQQVQRLPVGVGAVKVTTGMFYLPEGESTQSRGVAPDVHVPSIFDDEEIAEKEQRNALPATAIDPFEGASANPRKGGYEPVTPTLLKALQTKSHQRVSSNPEFDEIKEDIAERKKQDPVRLGELFEESEEEEDDTDEEEATPQRKEALNILADLVSLQ